VERAVTCDDCDPLLAAHAVGALDPGDDRELRLHLVGCPRCQATAAGYLRTADLLPLALEPVAPPAALRSRLLARVHAEAAGDSPAPAPRIPLRSRLWRALPAGRGLTAAGGLAGIAAAVLAVWSFAVPHHQPAAAPVLVSRACGLSTLPSACGTLAYTPASRQTVLTVSGLPALPLVNSQPVGAYAVWLIQGNGTPRLGAYLSSSPDGRTWTAVIDGDIASWQAVATTHEPRVGGTVPTGPELLLLPRPESAAAA
jgi:hypothetical protein